MLPASASTPPPTNDGDRSVNRRASDQSRKLTLNETLGEGKAEVARFLQGRRGCRTLPARPTRPSTQPIPKFRLTSFRGRRVAGTTCSWKTCKQVRRARADATGVAAQRSDRVDAGGGLREIP